MSVLELKTYPDPCLRIKTKPVEEFSQDLETTLRAMASIMYSKQGIGLAATQVGLGLRALVVDTGEGLMNLVNPIITELSKEKTKMEEGCLSLPDVTVDLARPESVKIRAQDEQGEFFIKKFTGLAAKVIQHEMDHLDGKLLIDYLDPIRGFIAKYKLRSAKRKKT